ncbi:MAG: ABC transporter ATP-binding protein [Thermomicrobiales bacterium]
MAAAHPTAFPDRTVTDPPDRAHAALELDDLFKIYREREIETVALRGASLTVAPGEFVAIVGPSGSGKSTLLGIIAGLTAPSAGKVFIEGRNIAALSEDERAELRRRRIGIVLQSNNLIPFLSARENVELAMAGSDDAARQRATALLERVGLGDRLDHRPARLSGGEQQRAAIAVALANDPAILLADELTGELDSVTAAHIMALLAELNAERGTAIILVTHNLALAAQATRAVRMLDGLLTPFDPTIAEESLDHPLADAAPVPPSRTGPLVLTATDLTKTYPGGVRAVRGISLSVHAGASVAIMGPSGCGKSTLLNLLGGLDQPTTGDVRINGQMLTGLDSAALALVRRRAIGFIFQEHNLIATLTAAENVALPLLLDGVPAPERQSRAQSLLDKVGLADLADKLPDQLSGGQRQRVAIARSIAHAPALLLADEPTGSLDSESAARITTLLTDLAGDEGMALVIVTHDSQVAARCQRVMYLQDGQQSDTPVATRRGSA